MFDEEGFATSSGKLAYELAYQQHRDHMIVKNWARFERMAGEASIWCSGGTTMFRSIKNVHDWVGIKQQVNTNAKSD